MASEHALRLAATVKSLRQSMGVSQELLAGKVGVHQTHITRLERGSVKPDLDLVYALAEFFGVQVAALLDGTAAVVMPKVEVTSTVTCEEHGIIGAGLTAEKARLVRTDHILAHRNGGRS